MGSLAVARPRPNKRIMKVCFVLEHFPPHIGGGETLFKEYTARLASAGCEVKVLTSDSGGVQGTVSKDGVEIHYFPWPKLFGHPVPKRSDLFEIAEWSDLVHTATFTPGPVALSVSEKVGRPCLITVYEALGQKLFWVEKNKLTSLMFFLFEHYAVNKRYSMFHAISRATQRDLISKGINPQQITTIYPGIADRFFDYAAPSNGPAARIFGAGVQPKVFLYYGRPGKTKGVFVYLDAIRQIRNKISPEFRFVFVLGAEPLAENARFRRLVQDYRLGDLVEIMDPLPDEMLIQAIRESFCVVAPSITEGFGYAAAESCALGRPVIASDGGSLPEVLSGKGLFFKNRDSADLSEKILMASRKEFMDFPNRDFSWEASTRELMRTYETLVGGR